MQRSECGRLSTSSGISYFWPGKEKTFFSLVFVTVLVTVLVTFFDELDVDVAVVFAFTFT